RFTEPVGPGSTSSPARRRLPSRTSSAIASIERSATPSTSWCSIATRATRSVPCASVSCGASAAGCTWRAAGGGGGGVVTGEAMPLEELAREWEWETTPELAFVTANGIGGAAALINRYSPHFVASIVSGRAGAFEEFYAAVDAPYIGNAFTRWVDGQWAWGRPELGLTNWERGRLLGRSGFLSGDDIVTVRDVFIDETGEAPQRR